MIKDILEVLSIIQAELKNEAKSTVKSELQTKLKQHHVTAKRAKKIAAIIESLRDRDDSQALQYIDFQGLINHIDEISEYAKVMPISLPSEKTRAKQELRRIIYNHTIDNAQKNDALDSLINMLIDIIEKEYENAVDVNNMYIAARTANDINETMQQSFYDVKQCLQEIIQLIELSLSSTLLQDKEINPIDFFYKESISKCTYPNYNGSELIGAEPLNDVYITPYIIYQQKRISVFDFIEYHFDNRINPRIIILFGEPGQGKTSLCWKAAYEFKTNGWLNSRFQNILRFSLNTSSFDNEGSLKQRDYLLLQSYLTINGERVTPEQCSNSLIFLDGFDELYDGVRPKRFTNFSMEFFLNIILFNALPLFENCCFIITSRKMCIEHELKKGSGGYRIKGIQAYEICKMSPEDQDSWIDSYEKNILLTTQSAESIENFREYIKKLKTIRNDNRIKNLLEIPILFRMVIHYQFLPELDNNTYSQAKVYGTLFHETMVRHGGNELSARIALEILAFCIFMDDDDSANLVDVYKQLNNISEKDASFDFSSKGSPLPSWIYSYYTQYKKGRRILFLHRSFYQYFLACYIYRLIKELPEETINEPQLGNFGRRRISKETFAYITDLIDDNDFDLLQKNGNRIFYEIVRTNAIIPSNIPILFKYNISNLEQAENVFWNFISILTSIDVLQEDILTSLTSNNDNYIKTHLLDCFKKYDCEELNMNIINCNHADLRGSDFSNSKIKVANFFDTDLRGANLQRSQIKEADFTLANLRGASLYNINLCNQNLSGADLRGADFKWAQLSNAIFEVNIYHDSTVKADLRGADLEHSHLENAHLQKADLRGANLQYASLNNAELIYADLKGADLTGADLRGANLTNADLRGTILKGTLFDESTTLHLTNFKGADLSETDLKTAILENAILNDDFVSVDNF